MPINLTLLKESGVVDPNLGEPDQYQINGNYAIVNSANSLLTGKGGVSLHVQKLANGGDPFFGPLSAALLPHKVKVTENIVTDSFKAKNTKGFENVSKIIHVSAPDFGMTKTPHKSSLLDFNNIQGLGVDFTSPAIQSITSKDDGVSESQLIMTHVLKTTYLNLLESAYKEGIKTIACPVISGGIFSGEYTPEIIGISTANAILQASQEFTAKNPDANINLVMCTFARDNAQYFEHMTTVLSPSLNPAFVNQCSFEITEKGCLQTFPDQEFMAALAALDDTGFSASQSQASATIAPSKASATIAPATFNFSDLVSSLAKETTEKKEVLRFTPKEAEEAQKAAVSLVSAASSASATSLKEEYNRPKTPDTGSILSAASATSANSVVEKENKGRE